MPTSVGVFSARPILPRFRHDRFVVEYGRAPLPPAPCCVPTGTGYGGPNRNACACKSRLAFRGRHIAKISDRPFEECLRVSLHVLADKIADTLVFKIAGISRCGRERCSPDDS